MSANVRALAAKCCFSVIDKGRSIADELPHQQAKVEGKDKALLQELCYGVLRHLPELEHHVRQFVDKPLKGKQRVFHFLLLVGVYQLKYTRIPDHAALNETVAATNALKNKHLKGMINAVLRNYMRKPEVSTNLLNDAVIYNHPSWLINKLKAAYDDWPSIMSANQEKPPMWLRVNQLHTSNESFLAKLNEIEINVDAIDELSGAIKLGHAVDVLRLPGFEQGDVSVQDAAAQQAARLLDAQPDEHILDCCAAPGGKTCHVLEMSPHIASMTALDIDENRLARVQENLTRLQLSAKLIAGDAIETDNWWDGRLYDRILLDAPCSATGVIRRHPDIKWLRKADDIDALAQLQADILRKMWSLLKPGGTLLYATCSILPQENSAQIEQFLQSQTDARLVELPEYQGKTGWQILPSESGMDGFYYAKLEKAAT
ncbi:16S rRNA (cytosine(967)-C(5))-methyltransferase RsmB [Thalassotalea atypica]|uniref:16S rRNA (cytosine(967)-C(5))-methyltransferase RsmB n=1 Tax=Thalassotalea atypica TaxID=2054316 RepID=UPI0025731133|nr:16S rRNA (cytosine(967)-C(5))-methyltransferase RsmB [Thalassotalea atypica]